MKAPTTLAEFEQFGQFNCLRRNWDNPRYIVYSLSFDMTTKYLARFDTETGQIEYEREQYGYKKVTFNTFLAKTKYIESMEN